MNLTEAALGLANTILVAVVIHRLLRTRNHMLYWSPLFFFTLTWGYYSILGPLYFLLSGGFFDRGVDMRPFLEPALMGGFVFYVFVLVGYRLSRGWVAESRVKLRLESLWRSPKVGQTLTVVGLLLMVYGGATLVLVNGLSAVYFLNPFSIRDDSVDAVYTGAFVGYFYYGMQAFIPGCIFLLLASRRFRPALFLLIPLLLATVAIYTSQGFRYRLVLLFGGMLGAYYLDRWRRPSVTLQVTALLVVVLIMGLIGLSRDYGQGLKLERLRGETTLTMLKSGMGDTGIFLTSGGIINVVRNGELSYVGFAPIKGALLLPIPSALMPDKDTFSYIDFAIATVYGREARTGAAYMFFGEWYFAFGWPGLMVASVALGYAMGRLWRWFLAHSDNLFAIALYCCAMPFLYVVLSRGYLAQVVMLAAFGIGPCYLFYWLNRRGIIGSVDLPRGPVMAPADALPPLPPTSPRARPVQLRPQPADAAKDISP